MRYTDPSGYKKAPVKEDAFIMDYANYWNRRTLYGGGSGGSLNSFFSGGSGGPGGRNGTGLNGAYYDHSSSTYRSTGTGNPEVGWDYALSVAQNYASERWWRQDAYAGSSGEMAYKGSIWKYSSSFTSAENIGRNQIGDVINGETITGFSGGMPLRDLRSGEGDPITGMPSFIGGPLRKGQAALKVGKYLFNPSALHSVKKGVLAFTKPQNFAHIVGDNPDILFKGGKVFLTGAKTSSFYGKSYETSLSIIDFLKLF
ncbi:MAG: hypothetical protein K0M40_03405 [Prolixibacteraceae bacterium]|nr:hypothetical protein [Prolixibacteraceae bacterium]